MSLCRIYPNAAEEYVDANYLTSGIKSPPKYYNYAAVSRKYSDMCGPKGRFFEPKEI
jgi:hypothetical protein